MQTGEAIHSGSMFSKPVSDLTDVTQLDPEVGFKAGSLPYLSTVKFPEEKHSTFLEIPSLCPSFQGLLRN